MLISENAGYRQFCECVPVKAQPGLNYVRIYTTYEWAKDPLQEQTKIELFLSDEGLAALRQSLTV
jgi:hypothetical protein